MFLESSANFLFGLHLLWNVSIDSFDFWHSKDFAIIDMISSILGLLGNMTSSKKKVSKKIKSDFCYKGLPTIDEALRI